MIRSTNYHEDLTQNSAFVRGLIETSYQLAVKRYAEVTSKNFTEPYFRYCLLLDDGCTWLLRSDNYSGQQAVVDVLHDTLVIETTDHPNRPPKTTHDDFADDVPM